VTHSPPVVHQGSSAGFLACCIADFLIRQRIKTPDAIGPSNRKPTEQPVTPPNTILRHGSVLQENPQTLATVMDTF